MKTFIVRMSQDREFDMEVEADDEVAAMHRAEQHAGDGERIANDHDSSWGSINAVSAEAKP